MDGWSILLRRRSSRRVRRDLFHNAAVVAQIAAADHNFFELSRGLISSLRGGGVCSGSFPQELGYRKGGCPGDKFILVRELEGPDVGSLGVDSIGRGTILGAGSGQLWTG